MCDKQLLAYQYTSGKKPLLGLLFLCLFCLSTPLWAQPALVLPSDGKSVQEMAPQGGLRFQRHLYLITPSEMQQTALTAGVMVNGIGFTFAAAQSDTTRGLLKVYLQNSDDVVSRRDTNWTIISTTSNSTLLENLSNGQYEWQVQSICNGDSSAFSPVTTFFTADPDACNTASNLRSSAITSSTALLEWSTPLSNEFTEYLVEHSIAGSNDWISNRTTENQLTISGLQAATLYQWRVQTICGSTSANLINASFNTLGQGACANPTSLQGNATGDKTATLSWRAAADAIRYDIQYRAVGSTAWLFGISFADSLNVINLQAGTAYEWRVRTVCEAGNGTYQNGPNFNTLGTAPCFPPSILSTNVLTDTSAALSWGLAAGAGSYIIRYRLKDAISWENAIQPMTLVHNAEILLPDSIGDFHIPFQGDGISNFNYTGGGIYIAWEYTNENNAIANPNSALATTANTRIVGSFGQDSVRLLLSLVAPNDLEATGHEPQLFGTDLRPATFLSTPALNDVVSVEVIHALGHVAPPFSSPSPISAVVKNHSSEDINTTIELTIKSEEDGSLRFSDTQNVSLSPNSSSIIAFDIWNPTVLGRDSLMVSIAAQNGESILGNNKFVLIQEVTEAILGYPDDSPAVTNTGFGQGSGLTLSRLAMNGCGRVNAAQIFLDASAADQDLYAVVLDRNGLRLDSSAVFRPDSTEVDHYHTFFFPNQPFFSNSFYYIGLAQAANPDKEVFPVGVQWETANIQDSAYFRAKLDGSDLRQMSLPGRLMIKAEVLSAPNEPFIAGPMNICAGTSETLSVGEETERFANKVILSSSFFSNTEFSDSEILGTPSVFPKGGPRTGQWISQSADNSREFIELAFPANGPINFIRAFETFNPGSIDTIYVRNPGTGAYEVVYTATAAAVNLPAQVLEVEFPMTAFAVDQIRIALASDVVPGFNGIDAVSIGQRQDNASFTAYNWSTGESNPSIQITTPGTYSVSVTDGDGCLLSTQISVEDPNEVQPSISIQDEQATDFCAGTSITLIADETDNILWNTGDSTSSIVVTESGTYFYKQAVEGSCGLVNSDSIEVTVYPLPEIALPAVTSICQGESRDLDAGAGFATYEWSTGSVQQTISVNTVDTYSVTVTDNNECQNSASTVALLTPTPNPQIVGDQFFCPGGSSQLAVEPVFTAYQWSNGSSEASIEINAGGDYSVTVVDENGCTGSTQISITELEAPMPVIAGNLSFCAGNTTTLDVGLGFTSYLWSTGETSAAIIVDTVDTYSVTVTDANGCTGSTSAMTSENGALPVSPGPISGPSIGLCQTTGNVYSIDPVPNTTHYVWTVPEGDTITSGQGTTSITVDFNDLSSGYIVVAASNACGQSPSITPTQLFVQGTPTAPGSINGPTTGLCNSTGNIYSVAEVSAATGYEWTLPEGALLISGQGTPSIVVDFGEFSSGDLSVTSTNNCGSSITSSTNSLALLGAPQSSTGREIVADGNTYTIAPINGTSSYVWTVPDGVEILSGQGTNQISIALGSTFTEGTICITAENDCGPGESTCRDIPLQVQLNSCSEAYIGYDPASCVELAPLVQGGTAPYIFSWSTGESSSSISICPEETTNYQLTVTDANGFASTVESVVEVYDIRCGFYNTFVEVCWSSGLSANTRSLCVTQSRVDYYLGTGGRLGNCELISCIGTTGGLTMNQRFTNLTDLDQANNNLQLFPNPATQALNVRLNCPFEEQLSLKVMDTQGKLVRQLSIYTDEGTNLFELPIEELPTGTYFLQVSGTQLLLQDTFIKL
ncbi:MAG: fibronectin type III domain-containing protein [Saprospiraceae bacterium]|nr:fibronectin type III domain-containing protein [Saprospiraceae bacterium]